MTDRDRITALREALDYRAALDRLTLEAHAALDRAGVPESLPHYGPESADCVEQMDRRCPHTLGVAERIEELRAERDTARADLAATRRALEELTRGRRLKMSIDEVVDMYRREEER